jgi:RimJ/RimL family protein N-acetyltransferase
MKYKETYHERVKKRFLELKSSESIDQAIFNSIPLLNGKGYLLCISELHSNDEVLIASLTKWRQDAKTFHNKFNVTAESTSIWLRELLLDVPDRILFLVVNSHDKPIGHMGFANVLNDDHLMEFDNVIRGIKGQDQGLMSVATKSLLKWANETFKPNGFFLRTLDDNEHAISFYTNLGFVISGQEPLRRVEKNGEINHLPLLKGDNRKPDRFFTRMQLNLSDIANFF